MDCDMFVNNPQVVHQAMCLLLGSEKDNDQCRFVQYPEVFYDGPADQEVILQEYMGKGMVGIQGPLYEEMGRFHRRKVIYGKLAENDKLVREFGVSKEFIKSACDALGGNTVDCPPSNISDSIEAAYQVANCDYKSDTNRGKRIGWLYGSKTEDVLTEIMIHKRGWRSYYCSPNPPAFLGCVPPGGPVSMTQQKRLATGLLEILFSKNNPIFAVLTGKLQFRQCLAYLWVLIWGLHSIPELCYASILHHHQLELLT
ncbi:hypothetical protein Ddye_016777 [Dipteronia dyeriana]|uniref:Uncharacterized protein n=1 Tax=Dipteronia dyeriana TaxID=168575 RepID=A0AAD9U815_9ROSI|nr:hypothetical protein Ddye_016777 [Dipteronia dyeriana]